MRKGRVLRFEKQLGAMLLKDMTILKFMLSAIGVGMIGILAMAEFGWIQLSHKPLNPGALICGGGLFGVGWALMGYCPGTAVGALGEGRWHALFGLIGMLAGAALYAALFSVFLTSVLGWADYGKTGLPELSGVPPWLVAAAMIAVMLLLFRWFEKKRL